MIRRPPRSTLDRSSAASDVYKRQPPAPSLDYRKIGPTFTPTNPRALEPAIAPERTVDGFVAEFLRELNFGGGASLGRSTVNHQYLALARTVRHYLMADWLKTAARRRAEPSKMGGYLSAAGSYTHPTLPTSDPA